MNKIKFGFLGFRHFHILSLYELCMKHEETAVCASCEEEPEARKHAERNGVKFTHDSCDSLLESADCDVVAIGDAFGLRGGRAIAALQAGKHLLSDKPICTSLNELDEIERLATENNLRVGCMLTRRYLPSTVGTRRLILDGELGEIHAIHFNGQHPLLLGTRPGWYFEPGLHGGTINDIVIHAADTIPWVTGLNFDRVNAARCWNAFAKEFPHFEDAGQMLLTMENGAGVLGDVSYFAVDGMAYESPYYWRMTYFGEKGILETSQNSSSMSLLLKDDEKINELPLPEPREGDYLEAFLADIRGQSKPDDLNTESVLKASRLALMIQRAADENIHDLILE